MSAAITCTSCNRPLRVPDGVLGQTVQCPLCLDEFLAQADPAAEAAARAAEPPARRAASTGGATPPLQMTQVADDELPPIVAVDEEEPVWVEPVAEAAPSKKAGRKTDEERSFAFPVLVTRDPDRVLRGRMEAELTDRGLHLRKPRQPPAFAAVGGKARYLGANRLVVTVEGRQVELVIDKSWTSNYHLAKDVAGFLNGQRDFPDRRVYNIPWILYFLPALFVALPFAAGPLGLITDGCLGVFLWCVIAAVLAAISVIVVRQARLTPRARLIGAGGLLVLGAAVYLISFALTPAYTVEASLWRPYTSPDGDFSVRVPGTPSISPVGTVAGAEKYTLALQSPEISFSVYVVPAPPPDNVPFNPFVVQPFNNTNTRAVDDAKNLLKQEFSLGYQYAQPDRDVYGNPPYHELFYQVPTGSYSGPSAGKSVAARVYVANGLSYTLAVFGPRVRNDGSDVVQFFNSFRLKASVNPKPPPPERQPPSPLKMPGLLLYYPFEVDAGPFCSDHSNHGREGTAHKTAFVDGRLGRAAHFDGEGSSIDFSHAAGLSFPRMGEFTFAGWVRTVLDQGTVLSNRNQQDASALIDVRIEGGALTAEVRQDGNEFGGMARVRGKVVNDGMWHHFALTRRGFGSIGFYVDGALQGGEQQNFNAGGPITTNLRALGAELYEQQNGVGPVSAHFTGDLDEFCLFNRALNVAEVRQLAGVAP